MNSEHSALSRYCKIQFLFFLTAVGVLITGDPTVVSAVPYFPRANFNDARIAEAADIMITYLTGSFGALMMTITGVSVVIAGAFGQYRAALSLMVVAISSFILRSLVSTWFNDASMLVD